MGIELLEMVVKMRKIVIFTTRRCYRSLRNHPFLVGMLCFLIFLYRSSPFVFSLLVSASPVLVCTAVLLGTLLSFGQPNIPEIERDEKRNHETAFLRAVISGDAIVVEKNNSYSVTKFTDERGDVVEKLNGVAGSISNRASELHRGDSVDSGAPLLEETSREMEFQNMAIVEEERKIHDEGYEEKNEINNERLVTDEAKTDDEDFELENDKSPAESFDSERVNVDSLDSPPGSPWKHVEEGEEQEEGGIDEDDEAFDSGSDRAESSSPDASMADIIPMLDELHPLLDEDAPQPGSLSHHGSDAASERSLKSSDSSSESDDDNDEKHEDAEVADEDNEDADDEDEAQGNTENQTKSAITWTEEDQKNLMDLGTSELERNQRLESLIARRRARKTISMMAERNLIDLDSADLPFNVAPISTARNNPFDLPHDSNDDMGLPPIPGSAPSILLSRQNPFDLPYDSSEEKPDLTGDGFQQEFTSFQLKEPFFRRHESFNVGPSLFRVSRQERQDGRLRPYFVAERIDSAGASYSSFQRQSSGLSDSKASSVLETDSVASAGDADEKNLLKENICHQAEPLSSVPEMELRDPAGYLDDKNLSDEDISRESDHISMEEDKSLCEEDISQEEELISKIECVSEHVGHGSQSSEEIDSFELGEVGNTDVEANEVEINLRHVEYHQSALLKEGSFSNHLEFNPTETHSNGEAVKQGYRNTSNSSSVSEISDSIYPEMEAEKISNFVERSDAIVEEAGIPGQTSQEGSDLNMTSARLQKEPVYDSSPPAARKNLSLSSISSDLLLESEMPPVLIKRTVSFAERESESDIQDKEKNVPDDKDMSAPVIFLKDENQFEARMATETSDYNIIEFDLSGDDQASSSTSVLVVPEPIVNHNNRGLISSQDTAVKGDFVYRHGSEYQADQSFSSVYADVHLVVHNAMPPTVECMATASDDQKLAESAEPPSLDVEPVLLVNMPYSVSQSTEDHSEHSVGDDVCIELEEKQISAHDQSTSEEKPIGEYGEELVFLDKSVDETASRDNNEGQETSVKPQEIIEEFSSRDNLNIPSALEPKQEFSCNINSPTSPESISILSEPCKSRAAESFSDVESNSVHHFGNDDWLQALEDRKFSAEATNSQVNVQNTNDDADEVKEFDEVLLSELDAVGDFSINELRTTSNQFEKHVASVEESSSGSHDTRCKTSALDDDSTTMQKNLSNPMNMKTFQEDNDTQNVVEVKCLSDSQTSGINVIEHVNVSSSLMEGVQIHIETLPRQNQIGLANSRIEQNAVGVNPEMPMIEARSVEDIEAILKISESTEITPQGGGCESSSSGMPVPETRTAMDIASAFKQMNEKIFEKHNVSELPSTGLALEETTALGSQYHEQHEGSSPPKHKMEFPILQARPSEHVHLDLNQSHEVYAEIDMLPDSVDDGFHEGEIKDSEPPSSELSVVETAILNDPSLALRQVSEHQQHKALESSAVFDENETGTSRNLHSNFKELGVQDVRNGTDGKLDRNTGSPENLTSDDARKERDNSRKSISSSNSSSSSDSSDSDT
ncbi:hypothetical protein ACH5RR_003246 [Cinchona calisaya]|uniref:Uncharacterized protein n=1 Tax=Cinchona calisaya TaxID=153742 RepID=A0ABD3AUE9_9GENT